MGFSLLTQRRRTPPKRHWTLLLQNGIRSLHRTSNCGN
ncbi:hypothetical protein IEO21_01120 [Rhodonia placenta]|uniref:Uncharacterized protein n=1 Tax=Rhodonia placenta TaxID=104341 RepID=A0A8H7U5P6_9APHY|nr:hypothetical protein IEO21_01120 [Postia placenta]